MSFSTFEMKSYMICSLMLSNVVYSIAFVGQNSTHLGFPLQRSHLIAIFFSECIKIAPIGHVPTHFPHALQSQRSILYVPVFLSKINAFCPHTSMQIGRLQLIHTIGILLPVGYLFITLIHALSGLHPPSFATEQTSSQIRQPVHFSSCTNKTL